ncbi:MAG: DMT family transporter [Chloroflexi bacterium]|nr:DMT family transporter [Chloroflexota bacterium]
MAIWAFIEVGAAQALAGYSGFEVVWARYGTHLALMLVVFAPRRRTALVRTSRLWLQLGRGALMLGMPACFLFAARLLPPNDILAVFWISPLLVVLFGGLVLGERVQPGQYLCAAIAFVGVVLILQPASHLFWRPLLLALGMALSFGVYVICTRILRNEAPTTNLFYTAAVVFVVLSAVLPFFWRAPDFDALIAMMGVGSMGFVLLWMLDYALSVAPASTVAPLAFTQPLWFVLLGLLTGRTPNLFVAVGALTVAAGIGGYVVMEMRRA